MQTINNNLIKAAITAHNHIQACDLEAQEGISMGRHHTTRTVQFFHR
jgi:hypothetical protein